MGATVLFCLVCRIELKFDRIDIIKNLNQKGRIAGRTGDTQTHIQGRFIIIHYPDDIESE